MGKNWTISMYCLKKKLLFFTYIVWHWNGTVAKSSYFAQNSSEDMGCIWLNSEFKNRVDTKPVLAKQPLPANSMSIYGSNVLVAGDNEAIYVIPKINL